MSIESSNPKPEAKRMPRAQRFAVGGLQMIYDTGDAFWSGAVRDVSETGLFVFTQHELPVGTRVTLLPETPDESQLPFEVTAEVARVDVFDEDNHYDRDPGIAFRLIDMSPAQLEQFRAFLARYGVVASK